MSFRSSYVIIHDAMNMYVEGKNDIPRYAFIDSVLYKKLLKEYEESKSFDSIKVIQNNKAENINHSLTLLCANGALVVLPTKEKNFIMFGNNEKDYLNYMGDRILLGDDVDESSYMRR